MFPACREKDNNNAKGSRRKREKDYGANNQRAPQLDGMNGWQIIFTPAVCYGLAGRGRRKSRKNADDNPKTVHVYVYI